MMKIKDYFKTKEPLIFFLMVFLLISPGVVYLFLWQRELFLLLDWVKLVLLCISSLLPISFLNTLALLTFEKKNPSHRGQELVDAFTAASIFTGFSALIGLMISYVSEYSLFWILVLSEVVLLGVMFTDVRKISSQK